MEIATPKSWISVKCTFFSQSKKCHLEVYSLMSSFGAFKWGWGMNKSGYPPVIVQIHNMFKLIVALPKLLDSAITYSMK